MTHYAKHALFAKKATNNAMRIEKNFGICIKDVNQFKECLIHPSAGGTQFQRLEFLGDRVLSLIISTMLFNNYPVENEGFLTKRLSNLVNRHGLLQVGHSMNLESYLVFDAQNMDKKRIVSDAVEAVIGALMLDQGIDQTTDIVHRLWRPMINETNSPIVDPKSALQEHVQSKGWPLPVYTLVKRQGKSHEPTFTVNVTIARTVPDRLDHTNSSCTVGVFSGTEASKKKAEQKAAEKALAFMQSSPAQ